MKLRFLVVSLLVASFFLAGCDLLDEDDNQPTSSSFSLPVTGSLQGESVDERLLMRAGFLYDEDDRTLKILFDSDPNVADSLSVEYVMRSQARSFTYADEWTVEAAGKFGQQAVALINLNGTALRGWTYQQSLAANTTSILLESIDTDSVVTGRVNLNLELYNVADTGATTPIGDIRIRGPFRATRNSAGS